ncbi:MAG: hypothetical protein RL071_3233 [Pseudomonadota bacterium]
MMQPPRPLALCPLRAACAGLTLALTAACGGGEEAAPPPEDGAAAVDQKEDLAAPPPVAPSAAPVAVRGQIQCPGTEGPWTVVAERVPSGLQQGTDTPVPPVQIAAVEIREGNTFTLEVPPGPRRRLRATAGDRTAWPARGAAPWEIKGPVEGLVLDCSVPDAGLAEVGRVPYARPKVSEEAWVQARGGTGGLDHLSEGYTAEAGEAALRARYRGRLTEEQLNGMMPVLLQLGQEPERADALVAATLDRGGAAAAPPARRGRR